MTRTVTASEAKAKLLALLDEAAAGDEIEITKHGRPVARIVPPKGARTLKGSCIGIARTAVDEDDLLSTGVKWNASDP